MTTESNLEALRAIIRDIGLAATVNALAAECEIKAAHPWHNRARARQWEHAGARLRTAAESRAIREVSTY